MTPRRLLILGFLALLAVSWGQVGLDVAFGKTGAASWQLQEVWKHEEADGDVWWLATAEGGARGAPVVLAKWDHALRVLELDGKVRTNGNVPWGTQMATGDLDDDGRDEVLLGAEVDGSPEPWVQAVNHAVEPFGPAVQFHDMRPLCSLLALDLDGRGGLEVALGDFRGCVSTMAYPDFLWDDCFPDVKGEEPSGDPHAARLLAALPDGRTHRLVVARVTGGVRVPIGDGTALWAYEAAGGVNDMAAADLDRDGRGEVILASPSGRVIALGLDGNELWSENLGEPVRTVEILEWNGDTGSREIGVGGDEGRIAVFDSRGRRLEDWDDMDGQVFALQRSDLDQDGRDELVAGMGSYQFVVLRPEGERLITKTEGAAPWKLAAREDLLVVGTGSRLNAYRLAEKPAPWWQNPVAAALLFTVVMGAVMRPLLRLHS